MSDQSELKAAMNAFAVAAAERYYLFTNLSPGDSNETIYAVLFKVSFDLEHDTGTVTTEELQVEVTAGNGEEIRVWVLIAGGALSLAYNAVLLWMDDKWEVIDQVGGLVNFLTTDLLDGCSIETETFAQMRAGDQDQFGITGEVTELLSQYGQEPV